MDRAATALAGPQSGHHRAETAARRGGEPGPATTGSGRRACRSGHPGAETADGHNEAGRQIKLQSPRGGGRKRMRESSRRRAPAAQGGRGREGGEAWRKRRAAVASAGPLTPAAVTLAAARVGRGRERRGERERGKGKRSWRIFFLLCSTIYSQRHL